MTVTVEEAEEIAATAKRTGTICAVNYGYSGYPLVREMRASERMPVRDKALRKLTERKFDMLFESPMAFDCRYMIKRTNAQDAKVPDFVLSPSRHTWPGRGHDEVVTR
mgnify:CR=1 FL=1